MIISEELKSLAKLFKKAGEKLYIVGGYVRNELMGVPHVLNTDIDICSAAKPEDVEKIVGKKFRAEIKDVYGNVNIYGEQKYEYTTFRKETYKVAGEHRPESIEYVKTIEEDVKRRDFTVNSIYYDIIEDKYIDVYDGLNDLENGVLKAIETPEYVFNNDALRILRMVRIACSLGLDIDIKTVLYAQNNIEKLKYISKNRIREEVNKILVCDTFYPTLKYTNNAHGRAMELLGNMGALSFIFPSLEQIRNSEIKDGGMKLYSHIMQAYYISSPNIRLSTLFHDVGKFYSKLKYKNFWANEEYLKYYLEINLGDEKGLGYNKSHINRIFRVITAQNFDKYLLENRYNVRRFIVDNIDIFNEITELMDNRKLVETNLKKKSRVAKKLRKNYDSMVKNNVPMKLSDLDINGDDIISNFIDIRVDKIGIILNKLFDLCLKNDNINKKATLLVYAKKYIMKDREFYLEA